MYIFICVYALFIDMKLTDSGQLSVVRVGEEQTASNVDVLTNVFIERGKIHYADIGNVQKT